MSKLFSLNSRDFVKGTFIFVASAVISSIVAMLQNNTEIDLKMVLNTAIIAFLTYLLKQMSTDENGKIGGVF